MQSAEIKFLRSSARYTWRDRKRDSDNRAELNTSSVKEDIERYHPQWHGHVQEIDQPRLPRIYLEYGQEAKDP